MFRNKSFSPCMRERQKGKGSFGFWHNQNEKRKKNWRLEREKIEINFPSRKLLRKCGKFIYFHSLAFFTAREFLAF